MMGSCTSTRMRNAALRISPTREPMAPKPTMPTVFSSRSLPVSSPGLRWMRACNCRSASNDRCDNISIEAVTDSATGSLPMPVWLQTSTPASVHAGMSMVS